jgi:hypothetical protein
MSSNGDPMVDVDTAGIHGSIFMLDVLAVFVSLNSRKAPSAAVAGRTTQYTRPAVIVVPSALDARTGVEDVINVTLSTPPYFAAESGCPLFEDGMRNVSSTANAVPTIKNVARIKNNFLFIFFLL